MNAQPDPGERFDQVESTLSQLANSERHLLTAQVLMNDRLERAETAIQTTAETLLTLAEHHERTDEKLAGVADKLDALPAIVRRWCERHGNGVSGQLPS